MLRPDVKPLQNLQLNPLPPMHKSERPDVKPLQNLQLNPLPPMHKSERPTVEPPAGHQLASTTSEALQGSVSCFASDVSPEQAGGFCRNFQQLLTVVLASYLHRCMLLYVARSTSFIAL
ncbi:hypothetical protein BRADI_2g54745v3 [Brachypodium distachyon]|uniref:Uncharacterized protein n=1 Tax=Brachypodium distachyon TaxID=15368 RepID=A0A2K2DFV8_BRADI|nr:hypothetical protein BRADI_2g54745v3 [Brachypodium distachyon]